MKGRKFLYVLGLIILFGFKNVHAQSFLGNNTYVGLKMGGFLNPGFVYGKELMLLKEKQLRLADFDLGAVQIPFQNEVSAVWDPFSHVSLNVSSSLVFRYFILNYLGADIGLGMGGQMHFLGETYTVNKQGKIKKKWTASRGYWAPKVFQSFLIKNKQSANMIISRIEFLVLFPYNNAINFQLNYSLIYQFRS